MIRTYERTVLTSEAPHLDAEILSLRRERQAVLEEWDRWTDALPRAEDRPRVMPGDPGQGHWIECEPDTAGARVCEIEEAIGAISARTFARTAVKLRIAADSFDPLDRDGNTDGCLVWSALADFERLAETEG